MRGFLLQLDSTEWRKSISRTESVSYIPADFDHSRSMEPFDFLLITLDLCTPFLSQRSLKWLPTGSMLSRTTEMILKMQTSITSISKSVNVRFFPTQCPRSRLSIVFKYNHQSCSFPFLRNTIFPFSAPLYLQTTLTQASSRSYSCAIINFVRWEYYRSLLVAVHDCIHCPGNLCGSNARSYCHLLRVPTRTALRFLRRLLSSPS